MLTSKTDVLESMRWLHTVASNAKTLIGGTFHGLDSKHLQSYLDEFGYRFNRRHMLDRIFERCTLAWWNAQYGLIGTLLVRLQSLENQT